MGRYITRDEARAATIVIWVASVAFIATVATLIIKG